MMLACRQFITDRLQELTLSDGYTMPFTTVEPGRTIYFRDLPRDFLKDNDYAAACLPLIDRNRKNGRLIRQTRVMTPATETAPETWDRTLLRRRYNREIMFRCLLFGPADELWGTDTTIGLVDQLDQAVAEHHHILDSAGSIILVEPQDIARPWDSETERERKLDRPELGIVRVQFQGGVHTSRTGPMINDVSIVPQNQ